MFKKLIIFITIFMFNLININALDLCTEEYTVSVVNSTNNSTKISCHVAYPQALDAMIQYPSDNNNTAVIYRNGTLVNARHAIIKYDALDKNKYLYQNSYDSSAYTYNNMYYGTDAALLGYEPNSYRIKIMLSGFIGYTDMANVTIKPLSLLNATNTIEVITDAINVRALPDVNSARKGQITNKMTFAYSSKINQGGYTWYKIIYNGEEGYVATDGTWLRENITPLGINTKYINNNGDIKHFFENGSGVSSLSYGRAPRFMAKNTNYYSFDGIYFYLNLNTMLDDYRNSNYVNAVNKDEPYFSYYLYLPNHSKSIYSANDFNNRVSNSGYQRNVEPNTIYVDNNGNWTQADRRGLSALYGIGEDFVYAANLLGVNSLQMFAAAINESGFGTSRIALAKKNLFGHAAYDSCPFSCATTYNSYRESIIAHANMTGNEYSDPSDWRYFGSHYGNKSSGMNVKYASDPYWGEKAAANYYFHDWKLGDRDYGNNTIGVKQIYDAVDIKAEPNHNSKTIYSLKNRTFSTNNIPLIVIDKVNINNIEWYLVQTDIALDDNKNIRAGNYDFDKSTGYVEASKLIVSNKQPILNVKNLIITENSNVNLLENISAFDEEDGELTSKIVVLNSDLNTKKVGTYNVIYQVSDSSNFRATKKISVEVISVKKPIITGENRNVSQFTKINLLDGVSAKDYDNTNIDNLIVVSGTVNTNILGSYDVTYTVTNTLGISDTKVITYTVVKNNFPVINASDISIKVDNPFNLLENVTATDHEDGILDVVVVNNNVNINTIGSYNVTYKAIDSALQETTKTIIVNVTNKELKDGMFYLEYLKENNGLIEIKGYSTINGVNNDLSNNINYTLVLLNKNSNATYRIKANRLINNLDFTRPIYGLDNFNYDYSWFKVSFNINDYADGDYKAYIEASDNNNYSYRVVSNKLYKSMITSFHNVKYLNTKIDFNDREGALEFKIRSNSLPLKNVTGVYNQYDAFRSLKFENDRLHIYGLSYSFGADLAADKNISRKIIFENKVDYTSYTYDLGSITNGLYPAILPVDDKLSKDRAWYENNFDISNIPVGEYIIYITTTSNITDVGELTDKLGRDFSNVVLTKNNKTYSFNINKLKGSRLELIVR